MANIHTMQTQVFFDGTCPVCTREMQLLRRWDRAVRLNLIDIAASDYDERAWLVSIADMNALLHVRLPDGTWLTGMAATRHVYRAVGRGWMVAFTGWPLLSRLFDRAYAWFAKNRLSISAQLGGMGLFTGTHRCTDGVCAREHPAPDAERHSRALPLDVGAPHLKFLITGGTGLIGAALTRRLIAARHEVTLVTRDPLRAAKQFGGAVRSVSTAAALASAEHFDVVVNLAGAPVVGTPWTHAHKAMLLDSRLAPTEDLLRYAARALTRPRVWIQASATGFYGPNATNIDESVAVEASDFASELCHRWEARAESCATLGIRYVALRFGLVMSRSGGSLPPLLLGLKLGAGSVIRSGRQFVSWIHIEDALSVMAHVIRDARIKGPINAVAPESVSYEAFMREAGSVTRRPWLRLPEQWLRKLLDEMAIMLVKGPCVLPGKLRTLHHEYRFRTLRSALTDLA